MDIHAPAPAPSPAIVPGHLDGIKSCFSPCF